MNIETTIKPKRSVKVRRRRYEDTIVLVHYNNFFYLDTLSDKVWLLFNGNNTIADVAIQVQHDADLDLDSALAATIYFYYHFSENKLLESNVC